MRSCDGAAAENISADFTPYGRALVSALPSVSSQLVTTVSTNTSSEELRNFSTIGEALHRVNDTRITND